MDLYVNIVNSLIFLCILTRCWEYAQETWTLLSIKPPSVASLARTVTVGGYPTLEIFIIKENPITILQDLTMVQ